LVNRWRKTLLHGKNVLSEALEGKCGHRKKSVLFRRWVNKDGIEHNGLNNQLREGGRRLEGPVLKERGQVMEKRGLRCSSTGRRLTARKRVRYQDRRLLSKSRGKGKKREKDHHLKEIQGIS